MDPWSQHLTMKILEYLGEKEMTKTIFLKEMCRKLNVKYDYSTSSNPSNSENDCGTAANRESLISILLKKHINNSNHQTSHNIEQEVRDFENITIPYEPIGVFWKRNESKFPILSSLSKKLIFRPATESASESAFSSSGCLISQKRAHINPLKAEKVLLVHHNMWLIEK